ncbi:class IV adenylate cyclase [Pontibacter anaerobius]|uniref:CYTH domain-containing protein n=1 Tax=Pontibacter anaerobius TaxID=2993940 RepID=A0ABT3RJT6_9BACT|nr:CYTH domain-containing protein [Pontibacter anaerobius]MCX2741825.1 CYTH domain-containing protein [Pontibacter anaerobius]
MYADITIKAFCANPAETESILHELQADFHGLDVQTDVYYHTEHGRLKHRQGNIENRLIHYNRLYLPTEKSFKTEVLLYLKNPSVATVSDVCAGLQKVAEIRKLRKLYFLDNVKFHLDKVEGLGHLIEIEAIDLDGSFGVDYLKQQCEYFKDQLQIADKDLVRESYIDLFN